MRQIDTELLHRVQALSAQALRLSNPNPRVGCVIADASGRVLAEGYTQKAGGPHAEAMALRDAQARGHSVEGATAYVSLEPCSHHGRTPPCCDALIAARVARVVVFTGDPNPLVAGQGIDRLRAAGIAVELLAPDSPQARASRELNIGFFSRMIRHTPWVRLKAASSLDGVTALENGVSQWITGEAARTDGHAWRARACAVLTGIGTVLEDDPSLDVRLVETPRQPHLVIVDSRLQTPSTARLFQAPAHGLSRQIWIYHATRDAAREAALQAQGATLVHMPGANNKVDLPGLLADLGRREVNELHVEAGHKLNGSFLREGLVDELLLYVAPTLLGRGAGVAHFGPLEQLGDGPQLRFGSIDPVGQDLRILARVQGRDLFLHQTPASETLRK
ncbi:bifunctional diaminohydroxyphosphoribosylaminopyrimidine deaminase/5-amino-6-(5-phosphoribosylamino)uracil reductase RibD [Hydrogenophaga sp. BPS33]|uniref:bifunctional diaminohydroxyphosphoribosylaminopyrimidine deaminase/5-amino-6-(5-phosphoribosylamino)uracil reductase RibD n=1 Tax=Hydrogenophaga sp. BPS33 TaxID=2651974 RepID=UPI00131F8F9D|nr:bifunctional diaminohydroxyphosphoribosylaminopyrimidine deaminase/5-amino-6-(5-phosphoribosylamino)uracil reductase RibD [Hydrogenophaga sp. BPS33]QHE86834.1 bifunctional diaminohydroxyphosphoribosylaminopyrimidine deaminase/5-amino-6-(5-phosphoribosylamino)uracil reductase RibD [Hydrogenophaga sp. BPS33]